MARICICEFCGAECKTLGREVFNHCNVAQSIITHLKRPNHNPVNTSLQGNTNVSSVVKETPKDNIQVAKAEEVINVLPSPQVTNTIPLQNEAVNNQEEESNLNDILPHENEPQEATNPISAENKYFCGACGTEVFKNDLNCSCGEVLEWNN